VGVVVRHYCLVCEKEQECLIPCTEHTTTCPPDCVLWDHAALSEARCTVCESLIPPGGLTDELLGTPWEW
jgi:hypothetical protein